MEMLAAIPPIPNLQDVAFGSLFLVIGVGIVAYHVHTSNLQRVDSNVWAELGRPSLVRSQSISQSWRFLRYAPAAARATAHRIRETVRAARRPENIKSTIAVDETGIRLLRNDLPVYDRNTDIISTNLSKMHFHKLDFGGGPPVRVFGWTYNGVRIVAAENGLEAHIFS